MNADHRSASGLRRRLVLLRITLFVSVAVFVTSLVWIDNLVLKILICVGQGLTGIALVGQVAAASTAIGRSRKAP